LALTLGARLGAYEITAQIGEGGMGEVYRARDTKLNRDVALKVLPDAFASDLDRLARFTREAQTLASLNHPNIAHIHGLEEFGGVRALVMELVEGDDVSWTHDLTAETYRVMTIGTAESLVTVFVGFACLTVAWLLVAVGMGRQGARLRE